MNSIKKFIKERSLPFITENGKLILQFIITALFIGLAFWFLKKERTELSNVKDTLVNADFPWLTAGILLALFYCFLQGLMYVTSFAAVKARISIWEAVILFLKRNFISVFLPAGGVSSLVFYTRDIEKKGISKTQIYFGSSIYGFVGILSVVIVAIPAFIIALTRRNIGSNEWLALLAIIILLIIFYYAYYLVSSKGKFYNWMVRRFPNTEIYLIELQNNQTNRKQVALTIIISVLIELVGIAHVYIAMLALHFTPSLFTALIAYLVMVVFLIVSPFLRGFGAIEISLTYVLIRFGFSDVQSIAIMLLFRFFEFWIPFISGIISFFLKLDKLLMRILPSILLFALGVINIISVMTPSVAARVNFLKELLLPEIIYSSNMLVLLTGLLLLGTSVFMLKGLRNAWWLAVILTITSLVGHLTKGIDFEEATVALIVLFILMITHREYNIKNNPKIRTIGLQTSLLTVAAVLIYGIVGFYFLDKKHFHVDFNIWQSIRYTLQNFFLIGNPDLVPGTAFARNFILSIKASGFLSIIFLVYTLIHPHAFSTDSTEEEISKAGALLNNFGNSPLDYFKTYPDKLLFWTENEDAFLGYRIGGSYAVVLENPVAPDDETMKKCIKEFSRFCYENGLKLMFYRIPSMSLPVYKELKMKSMFLGQEGIVDLDAFTLEGRNVKSIRNAIKKVTDLEYKAHIYQPPQLGGTLQKLKAVSDDWLKTTGREEICFSQGVFDEKELRNQVILTIENKEERIIAFLNIIPDYAKSEGTYDLLRKTGDAPNGVVDYILVELFNYFKSQHIRFVNIGFTPLSGNIDPQTFPEKSMKFVYERIRSFSHFRGQREYKEKFGPVWLDKFLVYNNDYDLLQAPSVLSKVIKL
jgi:phosphatidylglycerol lysyltransferase